MKTRQLPDPIERFKTRASILLKELRSSQPLRRKHVLAMVAAEEGFPSWQALKHAYSTGGLFNKATGGFLNRWFKDYAEAEASRRRDGGYLFPYRKQYFICEGAFIEALGLDPSDPDWEAIQRDWAAPADRAAYQRLFRKFRALRLM